MAEVVGERGLAEVTVAHVVARAGVSRRTFYELFEDREACFLAAFEEGVERAAAVVVPAYSTQADWVEGIRSGLASLLAFLDEEPGLRVLLVVDVLAAGPRALEVRARCLEVLVDAVDRGREEAKGDQAARLTAEGVVGAVFSIVHTRVVAGRGDAEPLLDLLGPLMGMIVLPYLGEKAALAEVARPVPRASRGPERTSLDPLDGLDMRLTYRTIRVLNAIGRSPGASNREVAMAAGIADQGQVSKLLSRLDGLGLIANVGEGPVRGAPNAWQLTARGERVEETLNLA